MSNNYFINCLFNIYDNNNRILDNLIEQNNNIRNDIMQIHYDSRYENNIYYDNTSNIRLHNGSNIRLHNGSNIRLRDGSNIRLHNSSNNRPHVNSSNNRPRDSSNNRLRVDGSNNRPRDNSSNNRPRDSSNNRLRVDGSNNRPRVDGSNNRPRVDSSNNRPSDTLNNQLDLPLFFTYSYVSPNINTNFYDSVSITPSQEQIEVATRNLMYCDIMDPINTSCPISLEPFNDTSRITMIRQCRHIFNTDALNNWFTANCRCPVCRYDIRDYNNESNIDTESSHTTSDLRFQQTNQSEPNQTETNQTETNQTETNQTETNQTQTNQTQTNQTQTNQTQTNQEFTFETNRRTPLINNQVASILLELFNTYQRHS